MNILDIKPNKVTTNLISYPVVLMSEASGDGKTDSLKRMLESLSEDGKKPLFLEYEDRYQHIPGIMAVRIHNMGEQTQVLAQLKSPKAHELYSCLVIDTPDQLDSMVEKYIADSKEVEITQDEGFGKGNKRIKNKLWFINELRNDGWKVNFCMQTIKNENITTHEVKYEHALNKETWKKISQDAYLIGMLTKDPKSNDRFITFKKTSKYPLLKDSLGMPDRINVKDFKKELEKAIRNIPGAEFTTEDTISVKQKEVKFEDVVAEGNRLGSLIFDSGKLEEAYNIFRTNIGIADEKTNTPKMLDSLLPTQIDLAMVVVAKMKELCDKYKIKY